ncbi:hypothetical protein [Rubrivivax albus]|uniref:hypothetical protein n=1 Tax=Rubrivivax albus TaxID=2499835 RepID=UPI0013051D89|nr:hypothetical protein [Rubrivivax albus]
MIAPAPTPTRVPPSALPTPSQLLRYESAGPLGGTFTCTQCQAQAWQPDLLVHAADCPYHPTAGHNQAPWRPA